MITRPTTLQSLLLFTRAALAALVLGATSALAQPFTVLDNGEVNVTTDTFNLQLRVFDTIPFDPNTATTLIVNAGATFNGTFQDASLIGFENTVFQINGGTFAQDFSVTDNTFATVNGGTFGDDVFAFNNTTLIINSGSVADEIVADGNSNAIINNVTLVDTVVAEGASTMEINGGNISNDVIAAEDAQMVINGGVIDDDVESYVFASIVINGGTFNEDIEAFQGSSILITGGSMGDRIRTFDDGEITILGTDFTLDGTPIVITEGIEFTGVGTLTGILSDGTPFSTLIETNGGGDFITIIPEPATGLLLLLGGATLTLRRRKR